MTHTIESIKQLLATNDRAICRALVALTDRQTLDEKQTEATRHLNGKGWRPCHARVGSSMSKFFLRNGYLTPKQINYWRKITDSGKSRIEIYAGQLLLVANEKATSKPVSSNVPDVHSDDYKMMKNGSRGRSCSNNS